MGAIIQNQLAWYRPAKSLPTPQNDGLQEIQSRGAKYGELWTQSVLPGNNGHGEEGTYHVLTNPTPGTAVAYALQTAFSDTAAMFVLQNENPAASDVKSRRVYLDFIKLMMSGTAPATTTVMHMLVKLDNISRAPSAGSVNAFPINCNMDSGEQSRCRIFSFSAAAMTVPASSAAARTVGRLSIPTSLGITGDEYLFKFGDNGSPQGMTGMTAVRATAASKLVESCAQPIIIGPGQSAVVYMWWLTATTTAPSFEFEVGIIER